MGELSGTSPNRKASLCATLCVSYQRRSAHWCFFVVSFKEKYRIEKAPRVQKVNSSPGVTAIASDDDESKLRYLLGDCCRLRSTTTAQTNTLPPKLSDVPRGWCDDEARYVGEAAGVMPVRSPVARPLHRYSHMRDLVCDGTRRCR